jgi:hypothetical protein
MEVGKLKQTNNNNGYHDTGGKSSLKPRNQ